MSVRGRPAPLLCRQGPGKSQWVTTVRNVILKKLGVCDVFAWDERHDGCVLLQAVFRVGTPWRSRRLALEYISVRVKVRAPFHERWRVVLGKVSKVEAEAFGEVRLYLSQGVDSSNEEFSRAYRLLDAIAKSLTHPKRSGPPAPSFP